MSTCAVIPVPVRFEVGNDVDLRGNTRTGSVLVEQMMVAGAS